MQPTPLFLSRVSDRHTAAQIRRRGVQPKTATRQTRLQTNNRSLSVDNIDRTSARNEGSVQEPSLSDVMQMLSGMKQDMNQRFDTLSGHLDTLNDSVLGLQNLRNENGQLKTENRELTDRLGEVKKKLDDVEGRSKRNNLIFTGLQKQTQADYESWEDCEKLVHALIHNQLKRKEKKTE